MTRVAVTPRSFRNTPGRHQELLDRLDVIEVRYPDLDRHLDEGEMCELVQGCEGLIVGTDPVTSQVMGAGPLRAIVKYGSGMDNIDVEAGAARGVEVRDTRGANARSVAELTIGLLLALARHIPLHDRRVRSGSWSRDTGTELSGRRLGLVGYGAVGREVATMATALGMTVVVHDPYVDVDGLPEAPLRELLTTCDAVSLHVPLTDETRGMIGRDELGAMRSSAYLINTARGALVEEEALAEHLRDGRLGGAAFDSFTEEPPFGSPLVELDGFISSPHAGTSTVQAVERTGAAAVRELCDILGIEFEEHDR